MSNILSQEIPLVFECVGQSLIGIVHKPAIASPVGVVTIIAGGPQYRGGVGRGMVSAARELAAAGVPVMRFDHRGLGDSGGDFLGFEHIAEDLEAAVAAFRREVPEVKKVVLWGGCDAASGAMIHGWKIPDAISMVLGNPWVTTAETQSAVMRKHYLSRLAEWSFWRKVLRFEYNLADYALSAMQRVRPRFTSWESPQHKNGTASVPGNSENYVARMLDGLRRFEGPVLFLMSGQSLLSKEFDELVSRDPNWREVFHRSAYKRIDFPDADQTFSGLDSRERVNRAICEWVLELDSHKGKCRP
ncbi:MAG: hydrolase 1, exosortase A system-associated [Halioglobus sp.]